MNNKRKTTGWVKKFFILTVVLAIMIKTVLPFILDLTLFLTDMSYSNFIALYAAGVWPLMEPYAAAFSVGPATQ